jgi:4-amino-4-deoxy-L-arabinose transferase-like glycosyltransferase
LEQIVTLAPSEGTSTTNIPGTSSAPSPEDCPTPAFVFATALAVVGLQLATGWRYGLFRDEFYYLACANHLDWGYVDHPPLSIVLLAGVRGLLGDSLPAVRLVPALLFGLLVWLAARLARELGGGRFAQSLAALAVAIAPEYLALTGFYSMNAFDLVFWAVAALLVARLVRTDDVRLWRPLGLVIGVGLLNKISMLFFAFGLAVAVLATPLRRHLARRELWEGVLLALVCLSPYVLWELRHDWATLEFMRNVARYKNVALSPLSFATAQIREVHPLNAPLWLLGLAWLLFGPTGRRFRALGIVFVATFAVLAVQHSKPYYLGPAFPMLLAAGAVVVEGVTEARPWRWVRPALLFLLATGGAVTAPLAIPVLPVETLIAYQRALGVTPTAGENNRLGPLGQHFADRFGWQELTSEVARIYAALSAEERMRAKIVTRNYGEAGAID